MITKKQRALERLSHQVDALQCPICKQGLQLTESGVTCTNRHTVDVAKQGYLHLAGTVAKSRYTKELFTARQTLLQETAFFEPLIEEISEWNAKEAKDSPRIVDMGCGEGTHLAGIVNRLSGSQGIGIDLSKEGIQLATNHSAEVVWLVADLAKSPLQEASVDVVLNILSPANHQEFRRILKPGGLVVKVIPNAAYLHELRSFFYAGTDKETFENEEAQNRFTNELEFVGSSSVSYQKELDDKQWRDLIGMTPLTWNADEKKVEEFLAQNVSSITIDLTILIGRAKG